MAWLNLRTVAEMVHGTLTGANPPLSGLSIDSRTLKRGDLFVAIAGPHHDGHDFAAAAAAAGAAAAMSSKPLSIPLAQVRVSDTEQALTRLAAQWRRHLGIAVVALTGSNGKTTTKEMIANILKRCRRVVATPGNYNNHIGVPLTLLAMRAHHNVAVVEMGANHRGEIRQLCEIAKPDIALLLNAGSAHIGGFGSLDGVAEAKGELFSALSASACAIVNRDDQYYEYWRQLLKGQRVLSFGCSVKADFRLLSVRAQSAALSLAGTPRTCRMQLLGRHNLCNALAAAAASYAVGASVDDIIAGLESFAALPGRLRTSRGVNGIHLIDDTYNANPDSLAAALAVLKQASGERWLVLGTMDELGENSLLCHARAGRQARDMAVQRLFTVGDAAQAAAESFGKGSESFDSLDTLIPRLKAQLKPGLSLLVKGSRCARMENVVAALLPSEPTTQ